MNHSTSSVSLSVCLPTYNPGEYLAPAVRSVLDQDFQDLELLVLDDSSTTPVARLLGDFKDTRLTVLRNERNLGIPGNWNRCIQLARGKYIAIFHHDDLMLPGNLSQKIALLDQNPTMGFVYSNIERIDESGRMIGGHWIPQLEKDAILPGEAVFRMIAAAGNPISCPSGITRAECYERLGMFDRRLAFAVDLEMWMRIAKYYDAGYLARPLIAQRVHPGQETSRFAGTGRDYVDFLRALDIVSSSHVPPSHTRYVKRAYQTLAHRGLKMARWKLRQGEIANGLRYLAVVAMSLSRACFYASTIK